MVRYEVPPAKGPGWQAFDVVQREPKDGAIVGGARLTVLVLPAEVIREVEAGEAAIDDGSG